MRILIEKAVGFIRSQTVLTVAFIAAVLSMAAVPPDSGYEEYIDFNVLILLFCLMGVVAGFRSAGVFEKLTETLLRYVKNSRALCFILMCVCFFTSMLVTNDVALITFVPLTLMLYSGQAGNISCIMTIVIQTAAANLGSMMTPIGNPQNLYLYSQYNLNLGDFISTLLPIGVLSFILLILSCLLVKNEPMVISHSNKTKLDSIKLAVMVVLFIVCILTVLRIIPYIVCLVIVCAGLLTEPKLYGKIDYFLLFTFVCFFIFVGNIGRIDIISTALFSMMSRCELIVSVLVSQVISNVPAAVMLSAFTDNASELLRGANIGGLGTPVASLASLISWQFYSKESSSKRGKYMSVFLIVNIVGLILLCVFALAI